MRVQALPYKCPRSLLPSLALAATLLGGLYSTRAQASLEMDQWTRNYTFVRDFLKSECLKVAPAAEGQAERAFEPQIGPAQDLNLLPLDPARNDTKAADMHVLRVGSPRDSRLYHDFGMDLSRVWIKSLTASYLLLKYQFAPEAKPSGSSVSSVEDAFLAMCKAPGKDGRSRCSTELEEDVRRYATQALDGFNHSTPPTMTAAEATQVLNAQIDQMNERLAKIKLSSPDRKSLASDESALSTYMDYVEIWSTNKKYLPGQLFAAPILRDSGHEFKHVQQSLLPFFADGKVSHYYFPPLQRVTQHQVEGAIGQFMDQIAREAVALHDFRDALSEALSRVTDLPGKPYYSSASEIFDQLQARFRVRPVSFAQLLVQKPEYADVACHVMLAEADHQEQDHARDKTATKAGWLASLYSLGEQIADKLGKSSPAAGLLGKGTSKISNILAARTILKQGTRILEINSLLDDELGAEVSLAAGVNLDNTLVDLKEERSRLSTRVGFAAAKFVFQGPMKPVGTFLGLLSFWRTTQELASETLERRRTEIRGRELLWEKFVRRYAPIEETIEAPPKFGEAPKPEVDLLEPHDEKIELFPEASPEAMPAEESDPALGEIVDQGM